MKKIITAIFVSVVLYADVDIPSNKCALIVASSTTMSEVHDYINNEISNKEYVTLYRANNGRYAIALGFLKDNEVDRVMSNWKSIGKIPQDSFCAKASRFREEISYNNYTGNSTNDKNRDTVRAEFNYSIVGGKVYLEVDIYNYYKRYSRGGLTVSFPQLSDRSQVTVLRSRGFESINKYPKYSQIYNRDTKSKMSAKYLLVEGWSDHWDDSAKRSMKLAIDTRYLSELVINIRGVTRNGYKTIAIPKSGPYDQQGYNTKRIVIDLDKASKEKSTHSSTYVNAYSGECRNADKPVLACSPSERDEKAFSMCAISMGGCEVAVNQLNSENERYVASQACAALSAELIGQKYTLDDMLGTFFVDSMSEGAKSQFDQGNNFFGFLLAAGTVIGKAAQLDQCIVNAKRNCTKEYDTWRRNCR